MFDSHNEFEKFIKQVKNNKEKYLNAKITQENYKFPHIYLKEEEIEEFNRESDKNGFDIKVVPLVSYMNLKSPDKNYNEDEDDEINLEEKEKNIEKFNDYIGKNYIGKKRNKILDDDSEYNEGNISSLKSKSYVTNNKIFENYRNKKEFENSDFSENNKAYNDIEEEKGENRNGKKYNKYKRNKKKKNTKNSNGITEKFFYHFRKIIETRQKQIDDEEGKGELINKIMDKSQNLTQEQLKKLAKINHISLIDANTLSKNDLSQKQVNRLKNFFVDISFDSEIYKLDGKGKESIKKMKNRIEREKKAKEDKIKNKRIKEQKRLQIENKKKKKDKNNENKKYFELSDDNSESDDYSI